MTLRCGTLRTLYAAPGWQCEELETEEAEEAEGAPKENPVNSLLDFPECEWWSCYDKVVAPARARMAMLVL